MKKATVLALSVCCACAGKIRPQASLPTIDRDATLQARQKTYRDYELRYERNYWGTHKWHRSDGSYELSRLFGLAASYPEAEQNFRNNVNYSVVGWFGLLGVVALGSAGIAAPSDNRELKLGLLGSALALDLTFLIMTYLYQPIDSFADVYNRALRRDLDVE